MTKYDTEPKTNHPLLQMDNDCCCCFFYRFDFIKSLDLLFIMFTRMWNLETQLEYLLCLITNNVFKFTYMNVGRLTSFL